MKYFVFFSYINFQNPAHVLYEQQSQLGLATFSVHSSLCVQQSPYWTVRF
jgi:hypothetical protein